MPIPHYLLTFNYGNDSDDYINIYSRNAGLNTTVFELTERVNEKLKNKEYEIAGNMGVIMMSQNDYYAYQTLIKKNPGTTSNGGGKKKLSRRKTRKNRRKY
jgi:hypothetical protein